MVHVSSAWPISGLLLGASVYKSRRPSFLPLRLRLFNAQEAEYKDNAGATSNQDCSLSSFTMDVSVRTPVLDDGAAGRAKDETDTTCR
ncbi:hypothetical protein PAMP_007707 [Pampus punctatissimus]